MTYDRTLYLTETSLEVGGKVVHSLEELEARMRGGAPPPTSSTDQPRVNKTEEDLSAFKKLVILYILYYQ